ncbi:MAG: peptidylprolyl isomerase [Tannerella sp.]|nr:peptidylprolyl isomerase [Tannerella sp.]
MKKIVMLCVSVMLMTALNAKEKEDPIIMTVSGKKVPLSEFLFIAKKDNGVDLTDKKSAENYVDLFTIYKLKVADAEALSIHKAPKFEKELDSYKRQLQESYLSDKSGEDSAMHVVYERTKYIPGFKHLLFLFPGGEIVPKDTVAAYEKAIDAYNRIKNGEPFEAVGDSLAKEAKDGGIIYANVDYVFPLQMLRVLEDKVFSMEPGELSLPVRTMKGFNLLKLERKIPNPGSVKVAHILTSFPSTDLTDEEIGQLQAQSDLIYQKALSGEDFGELAKQYSDDTITGKQGGVLPYFNLGEMVEPFEKAAYALKNKGDLSAPVKTRFGFHILKLLDKKTEVSFEEVESRLYESMRRSERNFDLFHGYDEKMKARHGYVFYPEAYAELQRLADEYFPTDTSFFYKGMEMQKPLIRLKSIDFLQNEFVAYISRRPTSAKTLSIDFMQEIFDLFVREIVTEMEREVLERDYPEYNMLVKEYYDGILLFEVSNKRVWSRPAEEQERLEAEWVKELKEKYPVTVNRKVLKNLKKYLN